MRARWLAASLLAIPAGVAVACGSFDSDSDAPTADGGLDAVADEGAGGDGASRTDVNAPTDAAGDAHDAAPIGKRVFLSSSLFNGNLAAHAAAFGLNGDAAAPDRLCAREAALVGLSGERWVAYVSFGGAATPAARVADKGARFDVTGAKILPAVGSPPSGPIPFADGGLPDSGAGHVWTGTTNVGLAALENCGGWTSEGQSGVWGDPTTPASWASSASVACSNLARLYCLED